MRILVTGSSGLIGGEVVEYFSARGHTVIGVDNNMRQFFFGAAGDTTWNMRRIRHIYRSYTCLPVDIRDFSTMEQSVFIPYGPFDLVIHCAAQPSHDKAREIPLIDFQVNALGTLNLLELTRQANPKAIFVFMSTNKVYGDTPNRLGFVEQETRWDYRDTAAMPDELGYHAATQEHGINENMPIDHSTHSLFGASKVAADVMVQEYGRTYGMYTVCFRGGCLTGPHHSGVALHGFLQYLANCTVHGTPYTVHGYEGKQVRDNIHSIDVASAIEAFALEPRVAAVYNLGGGRSNSISMLEAISRFEELTSKKLNWTYSPQARLGDHICYISDMRKFKRDYPGWEITKTLDQTLIEIVGATNRGKTTERFMPGDGGEEYFESYACDIASRCVGRVLDIGCGHGFLTVRIAQQEGVDEVLATELENVWQNPHPKVKYWQIDTAELVLQQLDKFDTIVCTEHMEHISAEVQTQLVRWVKQHLKPGGKFLGSMPNQDDAHNLNPFHLKTYAMGEWERELDKYFNQVDVWQVHPVCYCWSVE